MNYLKTIFSKEFFFLVGALLSSRYESIPQILVIMFLYSITALCLLDFFIKNYLFLFKKDFAKEKILIKMKKNEYLNFSKIFKSFMFVATFIPLILNVYISFEKIQSLTLTILWSILLIDGIINYFYFKKIKKEIKE